MVPEPQPIILPVIGPALTEDSPRTVIRDTKQAFIPDRIDNRPGIDYIRRKLDPVTPINKIKRFCIIFSEDIQV